MCKGIRFKVCDNSGALYAEAFGLYGGVRHKIKIGDIVKVALKDVLPGGKVKKGDIFKALVVRCKKAVRCFDGGYAWAGDNAIVLLSNNNLPVGTSVLGFACREAFLKSDFKKIASICEEVY